MGGRGSRRDGGGGTTATTAKGARARRLTELEAVVLGLVWAEGPCTAYAVRRRVQMSLSARWSGSAGAVYPAAVRLERRGLIRSRAQSTGRRGSQALEVTTAGRRAIADWLGPPVDRDAVGIAPDPLRTRLRFLAVLPPHRQSAFLGEAIRAVETDLRRVRADVLAKSRTGESAFQLAMARGARYATEARLRMLRELSASLTRSPATPSRRARAAGGPAERGISPRRRLR
jgi:DNA-binding PadR family transcriptional regulator